MNIKNLLPISTLPTADRGFIQLQLFCLALFVLASAIAYAPPVSAAAEKTDGIYLSRDENEINIPQYLWWSEDDNSSVMLEDILYQRRLMSWRRSDGATPNFGVGQSAYWFRFSIHNDTTREKERWLEIQYPVLDNIEVYQVSNGYVTASYRLGDTLPFSERPIAHRNFVIPLDLDPQQSSEVYLRVKTEGALQVPMKLWEPTHFLEEDVWLLGAQLIFAGVMLALAVYNLILGILIRDVTYFFYVLFITSISIVQLSLHGSTYQFLWPAFPGWNRINLAFLIGTSLCFACIFSIYFLNLHKERKKLQALLIAGAVFGAATTLFSMIASYEFAIKSALLCTFVLSWLLLGTGIYLWFKAVPNAIIFTIGWGSFLLGNISIALAKVGILPNWPIIEHAPQIGLTFEVFLFSIALAQRINEERRQRIEMQEHALAMEREARSAQQEMLRTQQDVNEELEKRVAARTEELKSALSTLSRVNSQLQELAVRDELTQLYSLEQFEMHIQEEWSRCGRSVSSLSLILLRVDNFSMLSEKYGQAATNLCLTSLARKIVDLTERAGDKAYRIEEDTFAMLMPHSAIENALHIAEQLRSFSEANLIRSDSHRFTTTLSIGISNEIPDTSSSFTEMIQRATDALETARQQGGNAVQFSLDA